MFVVVAKYVVKPLNPGVWPPVGLGLLLATPLVLAAVAMLRSVSWFVVVTYAILAFIGIANW